MDGDGNIVSSWLENVTISDEALAGAVSGALEHGGSQGVLRDLELRFMTAETPAGLKIAFIDMNDEINSMNRILLTSLGVGACSLVALFFISLLFSGWAMRPVKEAWERQRRFVADASHELKTPLTVMLMNNGIVLSHPEATVESQRKWLESSAEEGERMKSLIGGMLYLAKNDGDTEKPLALRFSLSDAVWNRILPFESAAYERGLELKSDVAPDIYVNGDREQIKQLIGILLDNAVKYAGEGTTVLVRLSRQGERALLSVQNFGEPIDPEDLPHIFERFYRGDKSRSREQGGYGLGLAIAKSIADSHRARLTAQSSPDTGTVFTASFSLSK